MKRLSLILLLVSSQYALAQSLTLLPGDSTQGQIVSRTRRPIITIYGVGSSTGNKMLFSFNENFPNWGLQYVGDGSNKMNFMGDGNSAMLIDLAAKNVGINNPAPMHQLDVNGDINTTGKYMVNSKPLFFASNWLTSPSDVVDTLVDGTCAKSRRIPVPELTNEIIHGGSVQVFFKVGGLGPFQLPYINEAGMATNQISFILKKPGEMIVYRHTFGTCRFNSGVSPAYPGQPVMVNFPAALEYRYVIIKN